MKRPDSTPDISTVRQTGRKASHQQIAVGLAFCCVVGLVAAFYMQRSLSVSSDPLLMPLDDTYIHFQYARQFAHGQPLVYNPGDPPTSGGTSLLYPPLLAAGYWLGFDGWSLAYWALGIGVLCLAGSAWLVYRIGRDNPLLPGRENSSVDAAALALAFAVSGPFVWAALSGMETALFVFLILLTLFAIQQTHFRLAVFAAALVTLTRPEGLWVAGVGMAGLALHGPWPTSRARRARHALGLALPVMLGGLQPLINLLATGSVSSSGLRAKSHLYNSGAPPAERIGDILEFYGRLWRELLTGHNPYGGMYASPILAGIALGGLIAGLWLAWRVRRITLPVIVLGWIVGLTAAVATLDTAFWQFKRYQLPVLALFFPAAAWAAAAVRQTLKARGRVAWAGWLIPLLILIPSFYTTVTFADYYAENVSVVRDQQVPMARWVADHLPQEARIGVHDVGLLRYFADRALYDVVGLTTPGPADSWRQGPGAIYEHMSASEYRPDYFAIYPDVQGLGYLVGAGVFGDMLAEFSLKLPPHNVAAAADRQVVYRANWAATRPAEQVTQATSLKFIDGLVLVDAVDVADLDSEAAHDYTWEFGDDPPPGFVTEVFTHRYHACGWPDEDDPACWATDGGRVLAGSESFVVSTHPGEDMLLVTRVHGQASVPLAVYVNDRLQAQRVQPDVPGRWLEVVTWVPGAQITGHQTRIRIEPQIGDPAQETYMPYYHWIYQGAFTPAPDDGEAPLVTFGEGGSIQLLDYAIDQQPEQIVVRLTWRGPAPGTGDGIVFVHLYDYNNVNVEPVAQIVERPADGVLPPGNWLPGSFEDTHIVSLPEDLMPGRYRVAVGLYDARSGERYPVQGPGADQDRRLFIGEITIEE